MKLRKFLAKLFVVVSTFFVVLTPIALAEEAGHSCNHEDCPICEVIRTAEENTKHTIKFSTGATVSLLIAVSFAFVACLLAISKDNDFNTPVSLKTKLSN
jgi:hypothetical protein